MDKFQAAEVIRLYKSEVAAAGHGLPNNREVHIDLGQYRIKVIKDKAGNIYARPVLMRISTPAVMLYEAPAKKVKKK